MEEESVLVAWNWVIEALAKSDLVDAALLNELCPSILGDADKGIAAKEAAALTCLQALYPSPEHDVPDSQFCLHPVQSCQHVLHRVWLETGNLQKEASDDLKSSVQTSVNHKKARFPNSTLQQLKDIIQQGNHSVFKEIDGLVFGDHYGLDVPSTNVKIPHPSETLCQQINTCNPASEINDQLRDVRIYDTVSGQSKTGVNGSCIDNHMEGVDTSASPDMDDNGPSTKKLNLQNQCGMPPKQHVTKFPDDIEDNSNNPHNEANQAHGEESSEKIVAKTSKENDHSWEENICMKCNKGGRLLSCCGSTCPLHFHETCLGCFVSFDDRGDFYCPICAYSRAAADLEKAKERASLARKELTLFIGGVSNDQPKHNHNKSSEEVLDQQIHEKGKDDADAIQAARSH